MIKPTIKNLKAIQVLNELSKKPLTCNELSQLLNINFNTMSRILHNLKENNYIKVDSIVRVGDKKIPTNKYTSVNFLN